MNDDTRDELLLAVAEWILRQPIDNASIGEHDRVLHAYARARHERERPEDRG